MSNELRTGVAMRAARGRACAIVGAIIATAAVLSATDGSTARAETLFALIDTGELFASQDGGDAWAPHATLPVSDAVALGAGLDARLHVLSESGSVWRSSDGAATWEMAGAVEASDLVGLAFTFGGEQLAASRAGVVWASPNDGVTWSARSVVAAPDIVALTRAHGRFALVAASGVMWLSEDDGSTWTVAGAVPASDVVDVVRLGGRFVVISESGLVWASDDDGASWSATGTLSQVHTVGITETASGLAAAIEEGAIAVSSDASSWIWAGTVNQVHVRALATDTPPVSVPGPAGELDAIAVGLPWPNPVSSRTPRVSVPIQLTRRGVVRFAFYDVAGRHVFDARRVVEPGRSALPLALDGLAPGVYYARVSFDGRIARARVSVVP